MILFGRGSTGGVVEQDSKTPEQEQFTNLSASGGTNNMGRVTADVNLPLEGTDVPASLRLNAMFNTNGVQDRDVVRFTRYGFAPSLTLGLGTDTRLTASYFYQSENDIPDFGQPWYFGAPASFLPRNTYYGYSGDRLKTSANIGTLKLEHDFTDWLTVSAQSRYASYSRSERAGKPTLTSTVTTATPLSAATITPNDFTLYSTEQQFQNQVNGLAKFATGDVQHDLEVGFEYDKELFGSPLFHQYRPGQTPAQSERSPAFHADNHLSAGQYQHQDQHRRRLFRRHHEAGRIPVDPGRAH